MAIASVTPKSCRGGERAEGILVSPWMPEKEASCGVRRLAGAKNADRASRSVLRLLIAWRAPGFTWVLGGSDRYL